MQRVLRGARVVIVNLLFRTARDYDEDARKEKTMNAEREEKRREGR